MNPIEDMTLRDYFAGQVIGPLMTSDGFEQRILLDKAFPKFAAEQAYAIADAMLRARSVPGPENPREWWIHTSGRMLPVPVEGGDDHKERWEEGWFRVRKVPPPA